MTSCLTRRTGNTHLDFGLADVFGEIGRTQHDALSGHNGEPIQELASEQLRVELFRATLEDARGKINVFVPSDRSECVSGLDQCRKALASG